MAIRKPKVTAKEARRLAGQIPAKETRTEEVVAASPPRPTTPSTLGQARVGREPAPVPVSQPVYHVPVLSRPDVPPTKAKGSSRKQAAPVPVQPRIRDRKTQVFLSAIIPAPGVSKSFDELARYYPASKALQMILRRAMSDYEILLANGRYAKSPMAYPVPDGRPDQLLVQTSRSMPNELVEVALNHFDPLGFESKRAFGLKLATAALATFFKSER